MTLHTRQKTSPGTLSLRWFLIAFLFLGCEGGIGGLGADRLEVQRCTDEVLGSALRCHAEDETTVFEPFALPIRFLGLVVVDNKAFIRMSPLDRTAAEGDQALVVIHDVAALKESLSNGAETTLSLGGPDADAELTLVLLERCECPHDPVVATDGTLTITSFSPAPG
ncbi:MAG: hypothetical protein VX938_10945, partial [Myxococcota bacterium]|nr:hypothetical protein [Myxococcota bacterium]